MRHRKTIIAVPSYGHMIMFRIVSYPSATYISLFHDLSSLRGMSLQTKERVAGGVGGQG
jgi:hypothetical protein